MSARWVNQATLPKRKDAESFAEKLRYHAPNNNVAVLSGIAMVTVHDCRDPDGRKHWIVWAYVSKEEKP